MRNRRSTRGISKTGWIVVCCVLALVLIALIVVAGRMNPDQPPETPGESQQATGSQIALIQGPIDEMVIRTVEEREDAVYVSTSYGDFTYPYAFSDLLVIEEVNEDSCVGLTVSVFLLGRNEPVYTLWINSDRGILAGMLQREEITYRVTMEMYDPRENLNEAYQSTFYAVQETLNDVLQSLAAGGDFIYSVGGES